MVFSWRDFNNWKRDIQSIIYNIIDEPLIQEIREKAPDCQIIGDLYWLNTLITKQENKSDIDVVTVLMEHFQKKYVAVRAFHGCRPKHLSSYTTHGLIPFKPDTFQKIAHEYFLTIGHTEEVARKLEEISEVQSQLLYEGEVSFHIDANFIVDCAGYYLIYGSHSLFATAILLSRATDIDFKKILAKQGKQTVFVCDIPLYMLSFNTIKTLCKTILAAIILDINQTELRTTECYLAVKDKLPAEFIVSYYHPNLVKDVLYGNHII
ncbi:MAG: hypothetical protein DRR19_05205 [Candidatus Parabeggiatoa sp. nov. 1]|nr:MAG: hypothetical protein DRR19_05205 [Gammaproteobacteria bacterium]HEC84916.1 hypothetical protein [Thioploca sp.]